MSELGVYKPIFYAQEALAHLQNALGIANRVHRGFDDERKTFNAGDTISIRRPSKFTVQNAPGTADTLTTETVNILLDQWKTVKFKLTDKEMAYSEERIIRDHIVPAVYEIADEIDGQGHALASGTALTYAQAGATLAIADLVDMRKKLRDQGVPMDTNIHFALDTASEADLLKLEAFTQHQGAGQEGVDAQNTGTLGRKYGIEMFPANNAGATYTPGTAVDGGDKLLDVNGALGVGAKTIVLSAATTTETIEPGDQLVFAGHAQAYTVSATATASGVDVTVILKEGLVKPIGDAEVVTLNGNATQTAANVIPMFHKQWAALAFARLPDYDNKFKDANISSIQDPDTGLTMRARMYYVGSTSQIEIAFDVLFGWKELNSMFAVKMITQ
jgi:hypothetical protein